MKGKATKPSQVLKKPPKQRGRPKLKIGVQHAVKLVIVNGLSLNEALLALQLDGNVSYSKLQQEVQKARKEGVYDDCLKFGSRVGTIVTTNKGAPTDNLVSPLTLTTASLETSKITLLSSSTTGVLSSFGKKTRQTSRQASVAKLQDKHVKSKNAKAYELAFKEATTLVANTLGRPLERLQSIAKTIATINNKYELNGPGKRKLCKSTIYRAVKAGLLGKSPLKGGRPSKIPSLLLDVVATHIEVAQASTGELGGKDVKRIIAASTSGTEYDGKINVETAWKKVRLEYPNKVQAANKIFVEDARAEWTTRSNLSQWFDDAKGDLLRSGLAIDQALYNPKDGSLVSEVQFIKEEAIRRVINMDETHHDLAVTGERGGPRSITYHNPDFQRGGKRAMKSGRHVTGVYATNASGEVLPPMYIFDSTAKHSENFRINVNWLKGLPVVTGMYGFDEPVQADSFAAVCFRGSMDDSLLNEYIRKVILPLYPNIAKTVTIDANGKFISGPVVLKVDAGPGRMVSSLESIEAREEFYEQGLMILMGLPNATSVQQEMDKMYGPFKAATYARGEMVVTEKLKERGAAKFANQQHAPGVLDEDCDDANDNNGEVEVTTKPSAIISLGFQDLATVVNGKEGDPLESKPFEKCFTKASIKKAWAKVGFVPFNRNCLNNVRVRNEAGQEDADGTKLNELQAKYDNLRKKAETLGFNPGIFDAKIPVARQPRRIADEDEAVAKLVDHKGAFSSPAMWNICGSRVGNAGVILRAQKIQLQKDLEATKKAEQNKLNRTAKNLEKAQLALQKYKASPNTMKDADWVDIIRWVLAELKATGYLKDYKKKSAIMTKLESLKKPWESYIPTPGVSQIASNH